jgi:alpha-galactosidase
MKKQLLSIFFCVVIHTGWAQKFEKLAPNPPMGWNSWNKLGCNVSEKLIKEWLMQWMKAVCSMPVINA